MFDLIIGDFYKELSNFIRFRIISKNKKFDEDINKRQHIHATMDTLGIWMNLTSALTRESDWKSIFNLSAAFGKDYMDYCAKNMPTPLKIDDVVSVHMTPYELARTTSRERCLEDEDEDDIGIKLNYIVQDVRECDGVYMVTFHDLIHTREEDETIVACPLRRYNGTGPSNPVCLEVVFTETDMFSESIIQEHFFGKMEYVRV